MEQPNWIKQAALKAIDDPKWFYKTILKFNPVSWQVDLSDAVMDVRRLQMGKPTKVNHEGKARITIRSPHGTGKTQGFGCLIHLWNFTTYGKVACTAAKEAQLTKRLMPRYRKAMVNALPEYKNIISVQGKEIRFANDPDWGAIMETASDPDNLAGYHDTPQLFLIDEASAKRLDPMYPVIEGALTTKGSISVEIGNPTRMTGEFYDHHNKPGVMDLYYRMHIKPQDVPELIPATYTENFIKRYGANSPITLIRALGEFASAEEYILIPIEYIEDAFDQDEVSDGSFPFLRVSCDIGNGTDASVITVMKHYASFRQLISQKAYYFKTNEAPIKVAEQAIKTFIEHGGRSSNNDDIVVDGIGVGAGTAGYLIKKRMPVKVFKGSETEGVDKSRWRNKRVKGYMMLEQDFRLGNLRISPDAIDDAEEFRAHLLLIQRDVDSETSDDIQRKRTLPFSPDRADSLMMQYVDMSPSDFTDEEIHIQTFGRLESAGYDAGLNF